MVNTRCENREKKLASFHAHKNESTIHSPNVKRSHYTHTQALIPFSVVFVDVVDDDIRCVNMNGNDQNVRIFFSVVTLKTISNIYCSTFTMT